MVEAKFNKKLNIYFLMFFLMFISLDCFPNEESANFKKVPSRPACSPYCEKIDKVIFVFVDETGVFDQSKKDVILNDLKSKIDQKKYKIRVNGLDMDRVDHFHQAITTTVKAEIRIHRDVCNKSIVKININIISPNRFYTNEFACDENSKSICIDEKIKQEVNKNIEDYLFAPNSGLIQ